MARQLWDLLRQVAEAEQTNAQGALCGLLTELRQLARSKELDFEAADRGSYYDFCEQEEQT